MSMENILELQQVSKTFPKSNFTLENVTFTRNKPFCMTLSYPRERAK